MSNWRDGFDSLDRRVLSGLPIPVLISRAVSCGLAVIVASVPAEDVGRIGAKVLNRIDRYTGNGREMAEHLLIEVCLVTQRPAPGPFPECATESD